MGELVAVLRHAKRNIDQAVHLANHPEQMLDRVSVASPQASTAVRRAFSERPLSVIREEECKVNNAR